MARPRSSIYFIVLLLAVSFIISARSDDCVYTFYIRTGSILKAGTDSNITVTLYDENGWGVRINEIESWGGLMGPNFNYFERGNLDIFSGRGPCLEAPICALNLTSDGSGSHHGWYCNYLEVTATGVHRGCSQKTFTVEQWLATDTSPYELTAIRDSCGSGGSDDNNDTGFKIRNGNENRVRVINGGDGGVSAM